MASEIRFGLLVFPTIFLKTRNRGTISFVVNQWLVIYYQSCTHLCGLVYCNAALLMQLYGSIESAFQWSFARLFQLARMCCEQVSSQHRQSSTTTQVSPAQLLAELTQTKLDNYTSCSSSAIAHRADARKHTAGFHIEQMLHTEKLAAHLAQVGRSS